MGVDEAVLSGVRTAMRSLRAASAGDKVHKEESCYGYESPESPGGLYVNLVTFQSAGAQHLAMDARRSGARLYLHRAVTRIPLTEAEVAAAKETAAAAAAAGGGITAYALDAPTHRSEESQSLALVGVDDGSVQLVPLPCPELPEVVLQAVAAVNRATGAAKAEELAVWAEERRVSKYADGLPQLDTGRKISCDPSAWRCDESGVVDNLWLNLSTGHIGSGRRNWDGTGGNGSALRHYEATGRKYPLVVKLGTITPHGADVYSYAADEDDMVVDPQLPAHLAHWGINMMVMSKTEKTMDELALDLNLSHEFSRITEAGAALEPLSGPGHVGLVNLGNSCYMASVMQLVAGLPEVADAYDASGPSPPLLVSAPPDVAADLTSQLAKLATALATGRTGQQQQPAAMRDGAPDGGGAAAMEVEAAAGAAGGDPPPLLSVRPAMFKAVIGRGHAEFSSGRQQDALEFFQHLLDSLARSERAAASTPGRLPPGRTPLPLSTPSLFTFGLEDRLQCGESGAVSYRTTPANVLSLDVPLDAAVNGAQVEAYKEREAKRARLKAESAHAYISADHGGASSSVPAVVVNGGDPAAPAGEQQQQQQGEEEEKVLPRVPFEACLNRFAADECVEEYFSAAVGRKVSSATKRLRLATFPPYLLICLKRYYVDKDWTPRKLEVLVDVPEVLDLEGLRATGLQPGEVQQPQQAADSSGAAQQQLQQQGVAPQPAAAAPQAAASVQPDPELVASLVSMGFGENGCKRAALAVGNASVEAAMEWVLGHMEDDNFNDPLPEPTAAAAAAAAATAPGGGAAAASSSLGAVDSEKASQLESMGFTGQQAAAALVACGGSLERAADWLFSRMDDLDGAVAAVMAEAEAKASNAAASAAGSSAGGQASSPAAASALLDGPGRYELLGFVSHMGSNTACGHYVAHIRKGGRWVVFNDEKVCASKKPPTDLGYMYLFRRTTPPHA